MRRRSKASFRVVWDEHNLDILESSKTPKQKIDEPKTPYHPPLAESSSPRSEEAYVDPAVHAEAIRNALSEVASSSKLDRRFSWTSSTDFENMPGGSGRRKSFEDHRREHYDEYRTAKMLQDKVVGDEEEGEDLSRGKLCGKDELNLVGETSAMKLHGKK